MLHVSLPPPDKSHSERARQHIKCPVTHTFLGRNGAFSLQTKVDALIWQSSPEAPGVWVFCRERRDALRLGRLEPSTDAHLSPRYMERT